MNPAAPRDPVVTKVLLYSAGALFVLNFCAFVSSLGDEKSRTQEVTAFTVPPPTWCGEVRLVVENEISDALLRQHRHPAVPTTIEIRRRQIDRRAAVADLTVTVPEIMVSF